MPHLHSRANFVLTGPSFRLETSGPSLWPQCILYDLQADVCITRLALEPLGACQIEACVKEVSLGGQTDNHLGSLCQIDCMQICTLLTLFVSGRMPL